MDILDDLNVEAESLLSGLYMDLDTFEEACDFIENHFHILCSTDDDRAQYFNNFMSSQIYAYVFAQHVAEEHKWVDLFVSNEFKLRQCIQRLHTMKPQLKKVLDKVLDVKLMIESKLSN